MPNPGQDSGPELDADVVCQECGMVNEPGTLICKQCGNNLRDQKRARLATGQDAVVPETIDRRKILSGLLSVFGILLVIAVALNVDTIVGYSVEEESGNDGSVFWTGSRAAIFDEMVASLTDYPPTNAEMEAALTTTAPPIGLEGRYVIREQAADEIVGIGEVRDTGTELLFVALMQGGFEVRGIAEAETADNVQSPGAAVRGEGFSQTGVGIAKLNPQQAYTIIGVGNESSTQFRYVAHAIPY